jgi:hypothetical protein
MKPRSILAVPAFVAAAVSAGQVSAEPVSTAVINVDHVDGKARAMFNDGQRDGVMPGDRGWFLNREGAKVGSDFEIFKVTDRSAVAITAYPSIAALQASVLGPGGGQLKARIAITRSCTAGGKKPSFDTPDVASGRFPPKGFTFATVTSTALQTDTSFAFTIDKGTDSGVLPASSAYAVLAGTGTPQPYAVDVTWATKTTAGGFVKNVANADDMQKTARKLGVEVGSCKPAS